MEKHKPEAQRTMKVHSFRVTKVYSKTQIIETFGLDLWLLNASGVALEWGASVSSDGVVPIST